MTTYVRVDSQNTVIQYPYTLRDLRRDNPRISIPADWPSLSFLAKRNVFPVVESTAPSGDVVIEEDPALDGGDWVQQWSSRDYTTEELAAIKAKQEAPLIAQANKKASAIVLREQVATKLDTLEDAEVAELAYLYDEWSGDGVELEAENTQTGKPADIVRRGDIPYRVVQSHITQPDFAPETTPALFTPLRTVTGDNPDPWVQPTGAQDAYDTGDLTVHDNPNDGGANWVYESNIDANTQEPGRDGTLDRWWAPVRRV